MSITKIFRSILSGLVITAFTNLFAAQSANLQDPTFSLQTSFRNQCGKNPTQIAIDPVAITNPGDKSYLPFQVLEAKQELKLPHDDVYTAKPITFNFICDSNLLTIFFPGGGSWPLLRLSEGSNDFCGIVYGHLLHRGGKPLIFLGSGKDCAPLDNLLNGVSISDFVTQAQVTYASVAPDFEFFGINPLVTIDTVSAWQVPLKNPTKPDFASFGRQVLGRPNTSIQEDRIQSLGVVVDSYGDWDIEYNVNGPRILYKGERVFSKDYETLFSGGLMASQAQDVKQYFEIIVPLCKARGITAKHAALCMEKIGTKGNLASLDEVIFA